MPFPIGFDLLPHSPGCYIYRDSGGIILYVGKAKDLKKRVSSYFTKNDLDPKTTQLVSRIASVDFTATSTENEAFLLENNLIKNHQPKYNVDLKDSRRYAYIQVTREVFPRVMLARKRDGNAEYFGPFTSASEREELIYLLNKTFRLRTCKKLPKRACLRKQIGLCDAPCIGEITAEKYDDNIRKAKQILRGDSKQIITELENSMKDASHEQEFEKAKDYRDQIRALNYLKEKQNVERNKERQEDIINYIVTQGKVVLMLFPVRNGLLLDKQQFEFDAVYGWLEDFLLQYYADAKIPNEIILPEQVDESIANYLTQKKGVQVKITVPEKGEKKNLLDLALKNVELHLFKNTRKIEALKAALALEKLPEVVECFDISHLSGTLGVASMVQFRNGEPDKSNYRRFKIKSFIGNDDYRAIGEVVFRRYSRLLKEKKDLPDLIVIDGGKGQLSSAASVLKRLGVGTTVISLAKQFEEVYQVDNPEPLRLPKTNEGLKLLMAIRDEAHRFAITYNRLLRSKKMKKEFGEKVK